MVWRSFRSLGALCALLLFGACGDDDPALDATDAGASDGGLDFRAFDEALQKALDDYNATNAGAKVRGASAVVVHRELGVVHSKGYGEFAADRLYLIASSSKILSAGVLKRLEDQGKLDFSAPISTYLGASWGAHKADVNLAQLLSNSAGLPSLLEIAQVALNPTPALLLQYSPHFCQYAATGTLSDCGKSIYQDDQPANNRTPDQVFRYGGSQWQLAGAVAEAVSGKSWAALIEETYVTPCGVPSLGYTNPFGLGSPLDYPGFDADRSKLPVSANPSIEGGGFATAPDFAKLLLMQLRGGKCGDETVLSPAAVAAMQTDRVRAYGGTPSAGLEVTGPSVFTGYGLGWWISELGIADPGLYGAIAFLELERGYGVTVLLEASSAVSGPVGLAIKPQLDAIFEGL